MRRALAALTVVGAVVLAGCDFMPAPVPPNASNPPSCHDAVIAVDARYGWSIGTSCVGEDYPTPGPNYAGWTTYGPPPHSYVVVTPSGDFDYWTQVIAHEWGHGYDYNHWNTVVTRYQTFCLVRGIAPANCQTADGAPTADAMEDYADVIAYRYSLWKQLDARTWRTIGGHVPTVNEIRFLQAAAVIP